MRGGIVCHASREEDIPLLLPFPLFSPDVLFLVREEEERKRGQVMGHGGRKEKDPSLVFGPSHPSFFNRSLPPSIFSPLWIFLIAQVETSPFLPIFFSVPSALNNRWGGGGIVRCWFGVFSLRQDKR